MIVDDVGRNVRGASSGVGRVRVGEGLVDWGAEHDAKRKSIKMLPAMTAKFVRDVAKNLTPAVMPIFLPVYLVLQP